MKDWEFVKMSVPITDVADALGLEPDPKRKTWYFTPYEEKTASLRIYERQNSFFDYSGKCPIDRKPGGDIIALWCYVRGCDSHTALLEIMEYFRLKNPDNGRKSRHVILRESQERKQAAEAARTKEKAAKQKKIETIEFLKVYLQNLKSAFETAYETENEETCNMIAMEMIATERQLDVLCGAPHAFRHPGIKRKAVQK